MPAAVGAVAGAAPPEHPDRAINSETVGSLVRLTGLGCMSILSGEFTTERTENTEGFFWGASPDLSLCSLCPLW